jgi:hypothetical protein
MEGKFYQGRASDVGPRALDLQQQMQPEEVNDDSADQGEEWVTRVSASEHLTSFDSLPIVGARAAWI